MIDLKTWDKRLSQEKRILKLLKNNDIVTTAVLRTFTYCHTARITALRKRGYIIEACKDALGRNGYRLIGVVPYEHTKFYRGRNSRRG